MDTTISGWNLPFLVLSKVLTLPPAGQHTSCAFSPKQILCKYKWINAWILFPAFCSWLEESRGGLGGFYLTQSQKYLFANIRIANNSPYISSIALNFSGVIVIKPKPILTPKLNVLCHLKRWNPPVVLSSMAYASVRNQRAEFPQRWKISKTDISEQSLKLLLWWERGSLFLNRYDKIFWPSTQVENETHIHTLRKVFKFEITHICAL